MEQEVEVCCIDVGNSTVKMANFNNGIVKQFLRFTPEEFGDFLANETKLPKACVIMGSGKIDSSWKSRLPSNTLYVSAETETPLQSHYKTPETLGLDRKCNALAALRYGTTMLAIDMGTCITYNLVVDAVYKGGAISPGWQMRLNAMHLQTDKLPPLSAAILDVNVGTDTNSSMQLGAQLGVLGEVESMIERYSNNFSGLQTVLTGSDANDFAGLLKCSIFADPYLTLTGLHEIYQYHQR